jgi:molybdopterin synthase catalytic subunit/molybdopterin converting factor small subunit
LLFNPSLTVESRGVLAWLPQNWVGETPVAPSYDSLFGAFNAAGDAATRVSTRNVSMKIGVLFFGALKDIVGRSGETVDLPEGARVREVLFYYARKAPRFDAMAPSLAISVNQEYSGMDRPLKEGDEVGLLPPVSGGSAGSGGEVWGEYQGEVRIVREPIDPEAVMERLKQRSDGAAVIFDGVVGDNTRGRRTLYLDYEAYEAMALQQMKSLAVEARARFTVRGASIIHRLGRLKIGETSVLIVVTGAHRAAVFEACRWIIDTLKKTVPIWKKEYFEDGAVWADGEEFPEEIRLLGGTVGKQSASK